ncbi:MAG: hypothetical protein U9N83_15620 [Thermodesulfobacteriota bacterium]|nr:hypothetical protein [Thermodesulfobacteriota bacterium]
MIIKTEKFELEVSHGNDVYFGSITSGQIFKRWEDIEVNEKLRIESIVIKAEQLLKEYEANFLSGSLINNKLSLLGA